MLEQIKGIYKLREAIKNILKKELVLCDMFDALIENGRMDINRLNAFKNSSDTLKNYKYEITKLTKEEIMANPYLSNIKIPNVSINNFSLSNSRHIYAGTISKYGYKTRDLNTMQQNNSYFVCDKNLRFPCLVEGSNNACWMSAEPFEFYSFESLIDKANGNVLLIGCGIGYASYMLSRKDDVKSVTIIDSNKDVLELFSNYILPQFEHPEKIQIINSDGIKYLKENDLKNFNYINVNIWYDVYDMLYPYLECLEIEKANPNVHFSYWLEEELKADIQKNILAAISGFSLLDMLASKIGKDIVENKKPHNYKEIYDIVNIDNLRELLYSWYINHKDIVQTYKKKDTKLIDDYQKRTNNFDSIPNGYMKKMMF